MSRTAVAKPCTDPTWTKPQGITVNGQKPTSISGAGGETTRTYKSTPNLKNVPTNTAAATTSVPGKTYKTTASSKKATVGGTTGTKTTTSYSTAKPNTSYSTTKPNSSYGTKASSSTPTRTVTSSSTSTKTTTYSSASPSSCVGCNKPLVGQHMMAEGKKYHIGCMKCSDCKKGLGSEYRKVSGVQGGLCDQCADKREMDKAPKCGKCRKPLIGKYVTAEGAKYHSHCFVCESCNKALSSGFSKVGNRVVCMPCARLGPSQSAPAAVMPSSASSVSSPNQPLLGTASSSASDEAVCGGCTIL